LKRSAADIIHLLAPIAITPADGQGSRYLKLLHRPAPTRLYARLLAEGRVTPEALKAEMPTKQVSHSTDAASSLEAMSSP
jgi:hypothetical protein